jgi:hypothetical protein
MSLAFKKFTFFQQQEEKGHNYPAGAACYCEGPGCLYVGCDNGSLHLLDEQYHTITSFNAHGHKIFELCLLEVRHGVPTPTVLRGWLAHPPCHGANLFALFTPFKSSIR